MDLTDKVKDDSAGAREIGFERTAHPNMSAILFDNLDGNAERVAVRAPEGNFTYQQLCALAARAGNALKALGLEPGARVLFALDDRVEYIAGFFGAVRAGFVPVLANILSPADQIGYFLKDSGARVMIGEAGLIADCADEIAGAEALDAIIALEPPPGGIAKPVTAWPEFVADAPDALDATPTGPDDMAFWMYSSGSTGKPKAVVHLHHDAAYTDQSYARHILKLDAQDICYSVPKIFFAYGFGNSVTFPFSAGASVVLTPGRPEPEPVFAAIERFKPTVFFGLPTLYNALIAHENAKSRDLSSLRLCISAAEILPEETFNGWRENYRLEIIEGLGSTEVLHVYLSNAPGDLRLGSAGRRVPGYEIELRDADGNLAAGNEDNDATGIMWVRGHSNTPCYWNRPEATADTMRGDWLYTGDRFRQDEEGFYYFLGRADDLIKVSGQWIYPLEIENCLGNHDAVVDCAVLGVKRANGLMTTKAFVEVRAGREPGDTLAGDMQAFVKQRLLPYKYPREVVFLDALPKTGTGKVDRQTLKQMHEAALAAASDGPNDPRK